MTALTVPGEQKSRKVVRNDERGAVRGHRLVQQRAEMGLGPRASRSRRRGRGHRDVMCARCAPGVRQGTTRPT
jgi:hypothetical protein